MLAENEIKGKETNRDNYVVQLRDALKNKNIGEGIELNNKFLLKFLRSRSYKIDETCELLKNYISIFKKYPHFFNEMDSLKELIESGIFYVVPNLNINGECITIFRFGLWEPEKFSYQHIVKLAVLSFELAALGESIQVNGVIPIMDYEGVQMKHITSVKLSDMKLGGEMTEYSLPIRWRKLFIVNENAVLDVAWAMAEPFMSKELKEKIAFVGSDMKKVHEFISPEILPARYGGTSDTFDPIEYYKYMKSNEPELMKLWQPFKSFHENSNTTNK